MMERMVASCGRFERVDSSTDVRQRCLAGREERDEELE